jgi:hypothetical protein
MKRIAAFAVGLVLLTTSYMPATGEELTSKIVGVWKLKTFDRKVLSDGKITKPFGEHPTGIVIYTKGGHFTTFVAGDNRKAPAKPDPTDAERIDLFKTMYGFGGTYKIEGNKIVAHHDTSWIQAYTGTDRPPAVIEIVGKQLTATSSPFKSVLDGQDIVTISVWEQVE